MDTHSIIHSAVRAVPGVFPFLSNRARFMIGRCSVYSGEKTFDGYFRQIWSRIRALFADEITRGDFIGSMAEIIQEQITRAWRAALRDNGEDPEQVNTKYKSQVEEAIIGEYMHVDQLAADVDSAEEISGFRSRAEIWANRYNDAYNEANLIIQAEQGGKMVWEYGEAEHCETCAALNGVVAGAREWAQAGVRPQNPPNDRLECGGWQCKCKLTPTNARRTRNALQKIMSIVNG